jgi:hypothetical protein
LGIIEKTLPRSLDSSVVHFGDPSAPNAKAPGDPLADYLGPSSRSSNLDLLLHWAEKYPNFNGFICSDPNFTILESDDLDTLQRYVGSVSLELFGTSAHGSQYTNRRAAGRSPALFFSPKPRDLSN